MLDVEGLETFLAVYQTRSFSGAARMLNRTQPAISVRIRQLERQVGASLFERRPNGIALSDVGRTLLPHAERAMAALQDAANAVQATHSGQAGCVALAVVGTLAGAALTRSLERFAAEHPRVDVALRTARSADVGDLVRRGEATIGVRYHRDRTRDLDWLRLGNERLFVACGRTHPRADTHVHSLAELSEERWIGFPESAGQSEIGASHVVGLFLAHGLGEVPWSPVDSLTAQKRLVESGFGIAIMPEPNVREELARGAIRMIHVEGLRAEVSVFAVSRSGGFLIAAAERLREMLVVEYAAELSGEASNIA